ncbi:MAG: polysaccharide biosynthesis tyrosine autokinase [Pseudoclavibacter sp.]
MTLQDYWRIVRRRWILILSCLVLGVIVAALVSILMPRQYSATASGFISVPAQTQAGASVSNAYNSDAFAKSRAQSYVELAQSTNLARKVASQLDLNETPADLLTQIKVAAPTNTVTLQVTATDRTPATAAQLANTWISVLKTEIHSVETAWASGAGADSTPVTTLEIYETATAPDAPTVPNTRLNLVLGVLLGLIVGFGLAVALTMLDRRIHSLSTITDNFDLPVIGTLPQTRWFTTHKTRLIAGAATEGKEQDRTVHFGEALREIRTSIQYIDVDKPVRKLVVTSSMPGDGKSTLSDNLAVTLAAAGVTTVLIDGDLRKPTLARTFQLPGQVGLSDVLAGRAELNQVLRRWSQDEHLFLLPAGHLPPNPSEMLGSEAMTRLIDELSQFATVIIDAPPVLPVADAMVLSTAVDGVVVAASAGKTTIDQLQETLDRLHKVNANVYGLVLNRVPTKGADAYGYGYGYGYGEYTAESAAVTTAPAARDSRSTKHGDRPARRRTRRSRAERDQPFVGLANSVQPSRAGQPAATGLPPAHAQTGHFPAAQTRVPPLLGDTDARAQTAAGRSAALSGMSAPAPGDADNVFAEIFGDDNRRR